MKKRRKVRMAAASGTSKKSTDPKESSEGQLESSARPKTSLAKGKAKPVTKPRGDKAKDSTAKAKPVAKRKSVDSAAESSTAAGVKRPRSKRS